MLFETKTARTTTNNLFDISGHAFLGHTIILSLRKMGDSPIEKRIKRLWFVAFSIVATITIIYYHTVPEYLSGMALAYGYDKIYNFVKSKSLNGRDVVILTLNKYTTEF